MPLETRVLNHEYTKYSLPLFFICLYRSEIICMQCLIVSLWRTTQTQTHTSPSWLTYYAIAAMIARNVARIFGLFLNSKQKLCIDDHFFLFAFVLFGFTHETDRRKLSCLLLFHPFCWRNTEYRAQLHFSYYYCTTYASPIHMWSSFSVSNTPMNMNFHAGASSATQTRTPRHIRMQLKYTNVIIVAALSRIWTRYFARQLLSHEWRYASWTS